MNCALRLLPLSLLSLLLLSCVSSNRGERESRSLRSQLKYPSVASSARIADGIRSPLGITIDSAGTLYVAGVEGNIYRVDTAGTYEAIASTYVATSGIALSPAGEIFVTCYGDGTIRKVSRNGGWPETVVAGLENPSGIVFDAHGNMYFAVNGSPAILKMTPAGQRSTVATFTETISGLAFDASGNLYATHQFDDAISRVSPSGSVSRFIANIPSPHSMVFDRYGNLFVSESAPGSGVVSVMTPDGFIYGLNIRLTQPVGLVMDKAGNLIVSNYVGSFLARISLEY